MRSWWCLLKNESAFQEGVGNPDARLLCTGRLSCVSRARVPRSSVGWPGRSEKNPPSTFPCHLVCANCNLVPSCQLVTAASYVLLSKLALLWFLLLLHIVKIYIYAPIYSKCIWVNKENLEVFAKIWKDRRLSYSVKVCGYHKQLYTGSDS